MKQRSSRLQNALKDLSDDSGDVSKLNRQVTELITECSDLIKCPASKTIESRLERLREPTQDADSQLSSARHYIQLEITALDRDIERTKQEIVGNA
jgi:3-methyladenine DNA glycosylase AlkC